MDESVLHRPIGMLCDGVEPLSSDGSIQLAAQRFRTEGVPVLPVFENGRIAGVVTELDLARVLATGLDPTNRISSIAYTQIPMLFASSSGAEALRVFNEKAVSAIMVIDAASNLLGILTPAHIYPQMVQGPRPRLVGGMATPIGVYLTTGNQGAGAPPWQLMLTGALMMGLYVGAAVLADAAGWALQQMPLATGAIVPIQEGMKNLLFLIGLRSLPIAGYHAAEHMVVHAIERGEELRPEIVKRMPRVHPRCGTNLAVAVGLFLAISQTNWTADPEVRLLVALLVPLFFWRAIGGFVQYWFTTRPPSKKQLEAGIRSGKELLHRFQVSPIMQTSPWGRILNSGILWVVVGSTLTGLLVDFLVNTLGLSHFIQVS